MLFSLLPPMVASGSAFTKNDTTGIVTVTGSIGSYFYRVPINSVGDSVPITDSSSYVYGYGYSFNASTSTYTYGYGYGYGFAYFASTGTSWTQGDPGLGFFLGTSNTSQTAVTIPVTAGGVATVAVDTNMTVSGLSGVSIVMPQGLVLTGAAGWAGTLTNTGTSDYSSVSSTVRAAFASGSTIASVSIGTGLATRVTLSDELIVAIPFTGTPGVAIIVDGAGASTTITACTSSQYTGATTSASALSEADNYALASAGVCYVVGTGSAAGTLYVATRHLSSITAGAAATTSTSSTTSGGSVSGYGTSKGSTKKTVAVVTEEEEDDDADVTEEEDSAAEEVVAEPGDVSELTDITGIPTDDWRYKVADRVITAGLFKGEKDKNGKTVFNGQNGMNRAMAAVVICRYVGCDLAGLSGNPFPDVAFSEWYGPSVAALKKMGIVAGKSNGKFDPGSQVTRAEFFKMLVEAYMANNADVKVSWGALISKAATAFKDVGSKDWFSGYFNLGYEMKLISGYDVTGGKEARGNNAVSRYEAAAMVTNFLDNIE